MFLLVRLVLENMVYFFRFVNWVLSSLLVIVSSRLLFLGRMWKFDSRWFLML